VTASGVEQLVHVGMFGKVGTKSAARIEQRLTGVAEASASLAHDAVARITEIGVHHDTLYAVAEAAEGVDVGQIIEHERRKRSVPEARLTIAVIFSLARTVLELHERGDVWAQRAGGLAGLFPAGIRPEAVLLRKDGAVVLRVLAGAVDDEATPTPFRAPELARAGKTATVAADVFALVQLMRAMLSADPTATSPPRLPTRGGALPTLLVSALSENPDDRPGLEALMDRMRESFIDNAANNSPAAVIGAALRREYRALLLDEGMREDVTPAAADELRKRLKEATQKTRVSFPLDRATRAPSASAVPAAELDASPTVAIPRFEHKSATSDAVDRVFTEEGSADSSSAGFSIDVASATGAARIRGAPRTLSDDDNTQKLLRGALADLDSAGDVPWLSKADVELVSETGDVPVPTAPSSGASAFEDTPIAGMVNVANMTNAVAPSPVISVPAEEAPAFAAPPFTGEEIGEMHDTVETSRADVPKDVSFADVDSSPAPMKRPDDAKATRVEKPRSR
jgi:hypothetical protein